jgi:hypothetical protein
MKSMPKAYLVLLYFYLFAFNYCDDICDENHCSSDGFACYDKDPINNMSCDQQCRPKYGITYRCFLCEGHEFYSISGDSCISCSGSFILSSKECVSSEISGLYQLGDIYYKECPSYSNRIGTGNQCNCENRYYEEGFNGKIKRTCLSPTSACPTGTQFYDFGDKKCYSGPCNTGKTIKKYETNGDIRCHSSCVGEEFYKDIGDSDICIDSCDKYIFYD